MDEDFFEHSEQADDDAIASTQHVPPSASHGFRRPLINCPEVFAQAQRLQEEAGWQRVVIEARLLAGQSADQIETATGVPADVIVAFEQQYFPVTHQLAATGVIFNCVIPAKPDDFDSDVAPFLRGAGYFAGPAVLQATLNALGPNARNLTSKHVDPAVRPLLG